MAGDAGQGTKVEIQPGQEDVLRRADWRFLLPAAIPKRSVCFSGERLSQAVTMVSSEVVLPGAAQAGTCDLAVVTNPTHAKLKAAWEALCPGGMFYGEWYSPLSGGPSRIQAQLSRAGFVETACYWPWPLPERASAIFWLPLEAPAALEYFMRTRPPSQNLLQGLRRSAMRLVWRLLRRAQVLAPVCVTARKPALDQVLKNGRNGDLSQTIQEGWQEWGFGPRPEMIHWLMLTGGLNNINKVVKFAFSGSQAAPQLVVKHARVAESIPPLDREAENLSRLESLPGGIPVNVPRLLFRKGSSETLAIGQTVFNGSPLYTFLRDENYRSFALKTTAWLGQLVDPRSMASRSQWWPQAVEPALQAFERKFGEGPVPGGVDTLRRELHQLESLPVVFEHRDLSPWNVLVTEAGELAVLDWEDGKPDGLPGMDLIYFLTFLAFFRDGAMATGNFLTAYAAAQDPKSFTGSIQAECLQIYFSSLGLNPRAARPLRMLAWVTHSLSVFPELDRKKRRVEAEAGRPFIDLFAEDLGGNG
jgi:hypothetical protein